jgi:hypothetical protein
MRRAEINQELTTWINEILLFLQCSSIAYEEPNMAKRYSSGEPGHYHHPTYRPVIQNRMTEPTSSRGDQGVFSGAGWN